jgi:methylglyoxal synthase
MSTRLPTAAETPDAIARVRTPSRRRTLALVAHESMTYSLVQWARRNRETLQQLDVLATGTTAAWLAADVGLAVAYCGALGSGEPLGAKIARGEIDFLVFLWDPFLPHTHDAELESLLHLAAIYDIPMACNLASANLMISALKSAARCSSLGGRAVAVPHRAVSGS